MNEKIETKPKYLSPFKRFCMTIGELPSSYVETMTYYEMLIWFTKYLSETVIPAINNNAGAVTELQTLFVELQNYVNDYFENLDVQTEIDNKLDEMAESGQLADIIAQYLELAGVLAYDTKNDLKNADNIVDGSICKTLGDLTYNDGKGHFYKIRTITSGDIVDEDNILSLTISNTLIAEKIPNAEILEILKDCFYEEITYTVNRDDTIGTDYYLTNIPKFDNDGNLIKLYMDRVEEENGKYKPSNYARKNLTSFTCNAALAIKDSDDVFYDTLVISNGEIINPVHTFATQLADYYQYLCIDDERNFSSYQANATTPETLLNNGVKQAWLVWYKCISNGAFVPRDIDVYNLTDDIRQMLGVKANGDIVFFTNDGRSSVSHGLTCEQACNILLANGVVNAWELDGGGSASTMVKTYKINRMYDKNMSAERNIRYTLNVKKDTSYKNVGKSYATGSKQLQLATSQIMAYVNQIHNFKAIALVDSTLSADGYFTIPFRPLQYYGNTNIEIDAVDNTRINVLKSGYLTIEGSVEGKYKIGDKYLEIFVNGKQRVTSRFTITNNNDYQIQPMVCPLTVDAGDYIEIKLEGAAGDRLPRGRWIFRYYGL